MFDVLDFNAQQLTSLSEDIRAERFSFLLDASNGILSDTWCEPDGRVRYWPGGKSQWNAFFELCDGEKKVLNKFCSQYECEIVGVGSGRVVLSPKDADVVFKVARYGMSARMGNGLESNKFEAERWEKNACHPLAEVLAVASDYSWLSMPQAQTVDELKQSGQLSEQECDEITETVEQDLTEVSDVPIVDVRDVNVGRINGVWKLVDYGKPSYSEERMYGLFPSAIHSFVKNE